jgi:hippurate hydrolase
MDALPMPEDTGLPYASTVDGAMHACGHDGHVAMLVGAARLRAEHRDDLASDVAFMFQPGEEGYHGARAMLDEGLLDRVGTPDRAFAIHLTPTLPSGVVATRGGPLLASADVVSIVVRGRGGHASMPHHAADPIPAACELVLALQAALTRNVDVFDPAVLTIAEIKAGTTNNVIPEVARLTGTLRAVSARTRARMKDLIQQVAAGVVAAHGVVADVHIEDGYPVTVNTPAEADGALAVARDVLGERKAIVMPSPFMGAEDFTYVLEQVAGTMVFLGAMPAGVDAPAPNHSNRMVLDEDALASGIAMHAAMALRHGKS